jgi:D-glycero-alpha-D-manno-heptose 1-phosphate guanylyltransferase
MVRSQAKDRMGTHGAPPAGEGFTAMVLAGGAGTRLRSVVSDRPKPLAPVGDEPFVTRLLDQLAAAGCTRAIVCTGHLGEQVEHALGREHAGVELLYSREHTPLGTGGALRRAVALTAGASHVLVANGDSYCDVELATFVRTARVGGAALLVADVPDSARFGRVTIGADGRVCGFAEKAASGAGTVNAGVAWLPCAELVALPADRPVSLEQELLPRLVAKGLHAFRTTAPLLDIGVPEDYARAEAFFAACAARAARPRRGLLVVDRDGTLIEERHYLADPRAVALLPGVVDGLRAFAAAGYDVAVVTNQSGIGRGYFDDRALAAVHAELQTQLAEHGIALRGIWHCPHTPADACACRKPEPELLRQALDAAGCAPAQCLVVGDKRCDVELGQRLGVRTALVRTGHGLGTERDGQCAPDLVVDTLAQLAAHEVLG